MLSSQDSSWNCMWVFQTLARSPAVLVPTPGFKYWFWLLPMPVFHQCEPCGVNGKMTFCYDYQDEEEEPVSVLLNFKLRLKIGHGNERQPLSARGCHIFAMFLNQSAWTCLDITLKLSWESHSGFSPLGFYFIALNLPHSFLSKCHDMKCYFMKNEPLNQKDCICHRTLLKKKKRFLCFLIHVGDLFEQTQIL